jgi:choline kinase
MMNDTPSVVVVLAAGLGSRLKSATGLPKPLRPVAGRALILRVLDRFSEAGIHDAVVVIGYRGDEIREAINGASLPMTVTYADNPRYEMQNGLSVLAARSAVGDRAFFLSMADHIFDA